MASAVATSDQAGAQATDLQRDAAILIVETAERICGISATDGSSSSIDVEGEADASISLLTRRLIGLGVEGGANLQESEYQNVLREQLADELKDSRQCRQRVFDQMFAAVFGASPRSVLDDDTNEVLEGKALPHQLEVIGTGQQFLMKPNDSVALGSFARMLTVNKIVDNTNLGPLVYFNWVDTSTGASIVGKYVQQAQPIELMDCSVVPFRIDVGGQSVSLISNC